MLKNNLNPIRASLNLYRIVDDVQNNFNFSQFTSEQLKTDIIQKIVQVLGVYQEPDDLINLLEQHDLYGKDCFWYIQEYELNEILNTQIFDQYITHKWKGRITYNSSLM